MSKASAANVAQTIDEDIAKMLPFVSGGFQTHVELGRDAATQHPTKGFPLERFGCRTVGVRRCVLSGS